MSRKNPLMTQVPPIKPLELMEGQFDDFIGVWENHMPKSVCKKFIDWFDEKLIKHASHNYSFGETSSLNPETGKHIMDGTQQFPDGDAGRKDVGVLLNYHDENLSIVATQYLQACFLDYINHYGHLKSSPLISTDIKFQRTPPCGGYHVWHNENSGSTMAQRVLVWMIYLNDMPDGEGETEFLYQKRRIKPTAGTCVIWPAAFTHLHRGLTVYSQNKYLLTGWYVNVNLI